MNPFTDTHKITKDVIRKVITNLRTGHAKLLAESSIDAFTSPMLTVSVVDALGQTRRIFLPLLQDHIFAKVEPFELLNDMIIPQLQGQVILPEAEILPVTGYHTSNSYIRLQDYPEFKEDYLVLRDALYYKLRS